LSPHQIEHLAGEVLSAFGQTSPPVNLDQIAAEEGIELIEGDFDEDFHGRIEFLKEFEKFVIYRPGVTANQYPSRVRFSTAHELGHYYLPVHREMLMKGCTHNSLEGFRHKDEIERQADIFAAALLIPEAALKKQMGRRGFLSLQHILTLAEDCQSSAQATAFRYTRFTKEPHLAFVSEGGKVLYCFASEEARAIAHGSVKQQTVPETCPTHVAALKPGIQEGKIDGQLWFPERHSVELWEEAVRLGSSGKILTLLSWVNYKPHG
jgi:IrrE N-terminal-like domain